MGQIEDDQFLQELDTANNAAQSTRIDTSFQPTVHWGAAPDISQRAMLDNGTLDAEDDTLLP